MRISLVVWLLHLGCGKSETASGQAAPRAVVLLTGEMHGNVDDPSLASSRRARAIERVRRASEWPVFLVDVGGFVAGGLYDPRTGGRQFDAARTRYMAASMAHMGYDAVVLGDEELNLGPELKGHLASALPMVSANVVGMANVLSHRIVERGGVRVAFIGVTSDEPLLLPVPPVTDPLRALRRLLPTLPHVDHVVLLSHLGEELSLRVADEFPELSLVMNGHRRVNLRTLVKTGGAPVVHCDNLGRSIVEVDLAANVSARLHAIGSEDPDSTWGPARTAAAKGKLPLDLYLSIQCSHCQDLIRALLELPASVLNRFEIHVGLVPPVDGEWSPVERHLSCARPQVDLETWLSLFLCASEGVISEYCSQFMVDESFVPCPDDPRLRMDELRTERLEIDVTPTIFICNQIYPGPLDPVSLEWLLCRELARTPSVCSEAPECLNDAHCDRDGQVGKCEGKGERNAHCVFEEAPSIEALVIADSSALLPLEDLFVAATLKVLPGIRTRTVDASSAEAIQLLNRLQIDYIPTLLVPRTVEHDSLIQSLGGVFVELTDHWGLNPAVSHPPIDSRRLRIPARLDVLIPPLDTRSRGIVVELLAELEATSRPIEVRLLPLLPEPPVPDNISREAAIWLALATESQAPLWEYLGAGADGRAISDVSHTLAMERVDTLAVWLDGLGVARGDLVFLAENREIIPVRDQADFEDILSRLVASRDRD